MISIDNIKVKKKHTRSTSISKKIRYNESMNKNW